MSRHDPAPDRSELPPLGPDDAPYALDWRGAVRGHKVPWLRAIQERGRANGGLDVVAVHLETGQIVYEAYHEERCLGRFESAEVAWEAARRSLDPVMSDSPPAR